MNLRNLVNLKRAVSSMLEARAIRLHRSRVGWRIAPRYTRYLERCRRESPLESKAVAPVAAAVETFRKDGITAFQTETSAAVARTMAARMEDRETRGEKVWGPISAEGYETYAGDVWLDFPELEELFRKDLGDFLNGYFKAPFKILYGILYRTRHVEGPHGSQLWHSDSGPGICVNVMYYLHDTTLDNGPLEALPWDVSHRMFRKEKRLVWTGGLERFGKEKRDRLCNFYENEISPQYRSTIRQPFGPVGLVVPFLNNTIHRGGYPAPGYTRTALVFHCYPSHQPTDFARYRQLGVKKTIPYPQDPAATF